jgi:hypothetical protein
MDWMGVRWGRTPLKIEANPEEATHEQSGQEHLKARR